MLAWFEGSGEICCLECKALGEVEGLFCHTEKGQLWLPISPQPEVTTLWYAHPQRPGSAGYTVHVVGGASDAWLGS